MADAVDSPGKYYDFIIELLQQSKAKLAQLTNNSNKLPLLRSEVDKVTANLGHVMARAPFAVASVVISQALTSCLTEDAHFCSTTADTQLELALTWSLPELHKTVSESVSSQFDSIVLSLHTCARMLRWKVLCRVSVVPQYIAAEAKSWKALEYTKLFQCLNMEQALSDQFMLEVYCPAKEWVVDRQMFHLDVTHDAVEPLL
jgi:hypothetical protein